MRIIHHYIFKQTFSVYLTCPTHNTYHTFFLIPFLPCTLRWFWTDSFKHGNKLGRLFQSCWKKILLHAEREKSFSNTSTHAHKGRTHSWCFAKAKQFSEYFKWPPYVHYWPVKIIIPRLSTSPRSQFSSAMRSWAHSSAPAAWKQQQHGSSSSSTCSSTCSSTE